MKRIVDEHVLVHEAIDLDIDLPTQRKFVHRHAIEIMRPRDLTFGAASKRVTWRPQHSDGFPVLRLQAVILDADPPEPGSRMRLIIEPHDAPSIDREFEACVLALTAATCWCGTNDGNVTVKRCMRCLALDGELAKTVASSSSRVLPGVSARG